MTSGTGSISRRWLHSVCRALWPILYRSTRHPPVTLERPRLVIPKDSLLPKQRSPYIVAVSTKIGDSAPSQKSPPAPMRASRKAVAGLPAGRSEIHRLQPEPFSPANRPETGIWVCWKRRSPRAVPGLRARIHGCDRVAGRAAPSGILAAFLARQAEREPFLLHHGGAEPHLRFVPGNAGETVVGGNPGTLHDHLPGRA